MIFKEMLLKKVLDGTKTQTRRPVNPKQPCYYKSGKRYAVQPGRGQKGIGFIDAHDVRKVRLGDISTADAMAEGFDSRARFLEYWAGLYGSVDPQQRVWKISFTLVRLDVS